MSKAMSNPFLQNRIEQVKQIYQDGHFENVVQESMHLLRLFGNNHALRRLLLKARFRLFIRYGYVSAFFFSLSLFVLTMGGVLLYKSLEYELKSQAKQIDSLISEVGDLHFENFRLRKDTVVSRKDLDFLSANVGSFSKSVRADIAKVISNVQDQGKVQEHIVAQVDAKKYESPQKPAPAVQPVPVFIPISSLNGFMHILLVGTNAGLSDTLLLLNINTERKTITTISIPRDTYVSGRKINEYYSKFGIEKLIDMIYQVTGIKADHYAVIDMGGFEKVIDLLGGIEVDVPKDIYDRSFPAQDGSYTAFSIKAGRQHLNGSTALKYVRSRKSTSDFDRAQRQQVVLKAIKDKLSRMDVSAASIEVYNTLYSHIKTDIVLFQLLGLFRTYEDFEIKTGHVISTSNLFYSTYNDRKQYILLPRAGNFYGVWEWMTKVLSE